jgi:Cys-tRNA synthase (O-phospho-L-seryl-tRNA:Cys-tRNA synthase)
MEISVKLVLGAVARVARYRDIGSGVELACCSVRGKLWATLLAYSPKRKRQVSWKVAFVKGRRAAMGIEGLEKWVLMTWGWR